jgi:hypothetical protein
MATKSKFPQKLWNYRGRYYKTERSFLEAANEADMREVVIYEFVESAKAGDLKKGILTTRERDEQLSVLLDNNTLVQYLTEFRNKLQELKPDERRTKQIVRLLKMGGMTPSTVKTLVSHHREWLIYEVSNTQEWYEILVKFHNFMPPKESRTGRYDYTTKTYAKIPTPPETIENFKNAKEVIRKMKKTEVVG